MRKKNVGNYIKIMQIRTFCMIADRGSASMAARNLFRTQSAITYSIRDLEHILTVSLFERHAGGMLLTEMGRKVLPRARNAMAELSRIPTLLSRLRQRDGVETEDAEPVWLFNERRLQIFLSLYRLHHTLRVANALSVTQPAVSAALKVLEKGAGIALFDRTPKGMMPTPAGHEIAPCISRALNEIRHIPEDIAAHRGQLTGTVYVGALPLSRAYLLPQAIIRLVSLHSGIKVATNEGEFSSMVTELRAGDVDFIIGALREEGSIPEVHNEALFEEELVLLVRPEHPLAGRELNKTELSDARWILPRNHAPSRYLLEDAFRKMGMASPKPVVESGDPAVVRTLLLGSDMVAAVSSHQLDYELSAGILVALSISLADTRREIGLMTRLGALHSPATDALLRCIREIIQETKN